MKKPLILLAVLATTVAVLVLPAAAAAEYLIPDGNSAVNQYTEGLPTGGGDKDTKGAGEKEVKPAKTIGAKTTRELEQKGAEGKALAEVAAETAPPEIAVETAGQPRQDKGDGQKNQGEQNGEKPDSGDEEAQTGAPVASGSGPSGSGGFGEIVSAATGSSAGGVGLLLPLVLVAAIAWGALFAWRRREGDEPATSNS